MKCACKSSSAIGASRSSHTFLGTTEKEEKGDPMTSLIVWGKVEVKLEPPAKIKLRSSVRSERFPGVVKHHITTARKRDGCSSRFSVRHNTAHSHTQHGCRRYGGGAGVRRPRRRQDGQREPPGHRGLGVDDSRCRCVWCSGSPRWKK